MDCVAGLFSGLWCIAVIQEQASPIYLRQHKSAQPSTANVVESIAPPISSHIPTTYNSCVPGKGELEGKSGLRNFECFPPRTCPCQNGPPERESTCVSCIPRKGHHLRFKHPPRKGHHLRLKHPPGKGITCVSSIPPERENILRKVIRLRFHQGTAGSELPEDKDPLEVHQTLRKYSDRKLPYRFLYKAPARSVPDTM